MGHWTENYYEEENNLFFEKIMLLFYLHFLKNSVLFVHLDFNS